MQLSYVKQQVQQRRSYVNWHKKQGRSVPPVEL